MDYQGAETLRRGQFLEQMKTPSLGNYSMKIEYHQIQRHISILDRLCKFFDLQIDRRQYRRQGDAAFNKDDGIAIKIS